MEKFVYLSMLYDIYGELLTERQQMYFKDYYFNNLSYGEMGEKYDVSRNAIFHQMKLIEKKLEFYEEKLKIYSKKEQINDIIDLIDNSEAKRII